MGKRVKVHAAILALSLFGLAWFHNNTAGVTEEQQLHRSLYYTIEDFADQECFDEGDFRVVSFGTSRAYGSGLPDPKRQSCTGLLGGTNLAIRASDARYPAMCAKSMVEDAICDVITIECMPHMCGSTKGAMLRLGERMRQRFPDSLIKDKDSESIKRSLHANMPMKPFSINGGKFALEASNPDVNFIKIVREDNDNSIEQHVYLLHMMSGPKDDFCGGAKFELHPNHPTADATASVEVSTLETWFPQPWHVINHKCVGRAMGRKDTCLTIEGNQTGLAASAFRAIGVNIVSEAPQDQFGGHDLRGWL